MSYNSTCYNELERLRFAGVSEEETILELEESGFSRKEIRAAVRKARGQVIVYCPFNFGGAVNETPMWNADRAA